jgi:(S)-2-hydroxyglutarate dehydrogenase
LANGQSAVEKVVDREMAPDFLIVGGGIIGICLARELKKRHADSSIIIIEKERSCALHASGRNSGVLHAGFYYTANSLKARFTRDGNRELTQYCDERGIPINKCGKLVVAQSESDHSLMDELMERGRRNGVELYSISEREAKEIEPRVKTQDRAIFSPTTSSVDPLSVVHSLERDAKREGIEIRYGESYVRRKGKEIVTTSGRIKPGFFVNAAGLYADLVARGFGFSEKYRILPFKGLYLYSDEPPGAIRTNIYPVPNLRNPFLGVHFTVTADGSSKIGPTAIPVLWREQYRVNENFCLGEFLDITRRQFSLFANSNFNFKKLALEEVRKYSRAHMVTLAASLAEGVNKDSYRKWGRPGIRAQLLNIKERRLEMDFVIEGDNRSMHVLNAVSPGFTCCLPFARYVCDAISKNID